MSLKETIIHSIEKQVWIDKVADPVQAGVRGVLDRAPALANILHGKFLGHPLHAALVTVPVGAWSIGFGLDLAEVVTGTKRYRRAADLVTTIGLAGALGAALAGMADWSKTRGTTKRVGFVHGALNQVIAGIYGASVYARSRKHRSAGIALSMTGFALAGFSAWLGGELAYRFGVGVDVRPEATPVAPAAEGERIGVARISEART
jgi:uncharacterized membrane protein